MRNTARPQPSPAAAHADQRDRAARLRDTAGRFAKSQDGTPSTPETAALPAPQEAPSRGTVPVSADAPEGTYALEITGEGLGLHADPGAALIVAPEMPTGAGLAVFYLKDKPAPVVFDLTHSFNPEFARPFAPGSEVVPLIEVVEPSTGRVGHLSTARLEKIHRVIGVYSTVDLPSKYGPRPPKLPLMSECPEGMGEHYAEDTGAYPLVRKGETVVYDPAQREPTHNALCVMQWSNGVRDVMLTNMRKLGGQGEEKWWVDPVNRLGDRTFYASDGPFSEDLLREKIVGTVVGVLVPRRERDEPEPIEAAEPAFDETEADEATEDNDDTELRRLGRLFDAARDRDLAVCRAINDVEGAAERVTPEMEAEAEGAGDLAAELAGKIADLPARTAAGLRIKLRALCHFDPASWMRTSLPELPDPDQRLCFSLRQDIERETETDADEPVTAESAASLGFEAYSFDTPIRSPREWNERLSPYTIGLHLADRFLRMSKPEMVAFMEDLDGRDPEILLGMLNAVRDTRDELKALADIVGLAHIRLVVAGSAVVVSSSAKAV